MTTTAVSTGPRPGNQAFLNAAILIVVGVIATTLAQPQVMARLPISNLLKNELHLERSATAAFFFWAGLPWYFKPVAGVLTDAFPLFGSRRKSYMVICTLLAVAAWAGLYFTPHVYGRLLWMCVVINTFMVGASTVVGAYMVETAQASSGSGRLTSIRQFVQECCRIVNGPAAGFLGSIAFGWTSVACGSVLFLLVPATLLLLREQRVHVDAGKLLGGAADQLGRIAAARTMWAAAGLTALFYIAPGLSTALFYRQQNDLHMDTQAQGTLALIAGVGGIIAALAYSQACRRFRLRGLLTFCLLAATVGHLMFLFYQSRAHAMVIEGFNGFTFTLAELALMDLAVRATPRGSEGLGFSLMVSVRNFALFGTDWLGSTLLDRFHLPFSSLVLANAVTTLIAAPLVLMLPGVLVRSRDAELYEDAAAPPTAMQD